MQKEEETWEEEPDISFLEAGIDEVLGTLDMCIIVYEYKKRK
jgi:hypothetical protein